MTVVMYRYINGIILNPREYLLDEQNKVMEFANFRSALDHLEANGITNLEEYGIHVVDQEWVEDDLLERAHEPLDDAVAWEENEIAQERED